MSVTFYVYGQDNEDLELNVSNSNARDLFSWLGYDEEAQGELHGELNARELAARCRRRLWPEARNHDAAVPSYVETGTGGATLISCGRPAGYLEDRTRQLLKLAEAVGDGPITFS